jgi:AraC family chitin signaling transcriptional activator
MVGAVNQVFNKIRGFVLFCATGLGMSLAPAIVFHVHAQQAADQQSIHGTPRVIHYTRKEFNSDPQIWSMCQDQDGILYFGTNSGTLIYDGETWQNVKLPNKSSVRSLGVSHDGTVYAGGFNDFGIIKKDIYGQYYYSSLMNLLRPEDRNIENIWGIHEVQGHMVFRSYGRLIAIANNKAVTMTTAAVYDNSTVLNDKLFVKDGEEVKVVDLHSLEVTRVIGPQDLNNESFLTVLPGYGKHETLVITKQGSLFDLDLAGNKTTFIQRLIGVNANNRITTAIKSTTGNYYLGTLTSKVIALNSIGEQAMPGEVFHELQDNTVHYLFESHEGNIWALLNNGIDCIDVSSPVSRLYDDASIMDVLIDRDKMYMATNQGVIVAELGEHRNKILKTDFKNITGLEAQAWSLQKFEDHVICSHDDGVIIFSKDGTYKKLAGPRGIWKVISVKGKPGYYLVCTYDGLYLMRYDASSGFRIEHRLQGFNESSRDILQGDQPGIFWVCHGYKGVFRIKIDSDFKRVISLEHFKDKNGLPSPFNINVFHWNGQIVFTTNAGVFTFNEQQNRFEPHPFLTKVLGTEYNIRKIFEFGDRTWFVQHDEVGYFLTRSEDPQLVKGLFLQLKGTLNESMECIVPVNDNNVLIGTREGLFSFDLAYNPSRKDARTMIARVTYKEGDNEVAVPVNSSANKQKFPHSTTSVRFNFSVPGFDDKMNIQYSYRMDGISENWSPWQETPFQEYTLLRPGNYVFHVKARSLLGEKAGEATYSLQLIPVWYKTNVAYLIYALVSLLLIAMIVRLIQRRIDYVRKKTIAEEEEKRKVLQLEIDHIKLEREREQMMKDKELLEEDIIFKSKELANYTMLLVKKRELLSEMSEDLKALKEVVRNDQARQGVRELQRKINVNLQSEEHLKVFEANFERVHSDFFAQLKNNFPDLTQKELQLCAFVKMNLTNKEIASILNLSVRGIETARYRLRKRLGITHEQDMVDFLDKLYSSSDVSPELKD